ncbi:hypothetical protein PSH70_17900 [Pseudomonas fluorescens]|uniref:hypothetical protein n=1 Tax=Pseudomonas fluorescens TaxID=294 RepID=UPI0027331BA0|nr:hypothetical protein [Pseudomonas fluorescens]WLH71853.1 hypothetical protein PSH70_17900 [Pseudomonas fluorescens]
MSQNLASFGVVRALMAVLYVAGLSGCMAPTMNEARRGGPYKVLTSKKTDAAVAKCVHYEWQNQSIFGGTPGATLQPGRDTGYTVFTEGSQYFVDIQPKGAGSEAKYYVVVGNWIANKRLTALQGCL